MVVFGYGNHDEIHDIVIKRIFHTGIPDILFIKKEATMNSTPEAADSPEPLVKPQKKNQRSASYYFLGFYCVSAWDCVF